MNLETPWEDDAWIRQSTIILDSYRHWLRRGLCPHAEDPKEQAKTLFLASCVVVSHGIEADPILNYGNRAALQLFQTDLPSLLQMPSRLTAELAHRGERQSLMERTRQHGFINDYHGIRISCEGKRFRIENATVWNLIDDQHQSIGQAASFAEWEFI